MDGKKPFFMIADDSAKAENLFSELHPLRSILSAGGAGAALALSEGGSDAVCFRVDTQAAMDIYHHVALDPVTEAYTKPFFMEYAAQMLKSHPQQGYDLVCLELESFELLHGRYGIELCDVFMRTMVKSLGALLSSDAIMGRMDDSHVAFFMPHIPFPLHVEMMQNCNKMAEQSPFPFFAIYAGVCAADQSLSVAELYRNCLLAIDGIRFLPDRFIAEYDDSLRQKKQRDKIIQGHMYTALQEGQFQIYYQPKFNTCGDTIQGAEALVRWMHPQLGFLNPGDFIPLFEKNGFIFELDKYVLESVCKDLRRWLELGRHVVPVSVNVSQTDFDQQDLDSLFEKIVDKYGIPHENIHFEITETSDAPDARKKRIAVSGFRKRGFAVELDDFGAGYSTLSILKSMPVDVMKTDTSLIRDLSDPNCRAILEGALFTAVRLNIGVVVEGVENSDQYRVLREICQDRLKPDIQGYYFSKPMPRDAFETYLLEIPHFQPKTDA